MKEELIKIFKHLQKIYSPAELKEFANKEDLTSYHFGMGAYIRNTFIWNNDLHGKLKTYYQETYADNVSDCLIKDFQEYLKNKF